MGVMRGVSLKEVVRTVHMKMDLARLQHECWTSSSPTSPSSLT